jgi:2-polyprenyl-3-methyl-5-hydroxy-6-metoxy-1,4-benzoquinol methylase
VTVAWVTQLMVCAFPSRGAGEGAHAYDASMGTLSLKHRHVVPELMDAPDLDPVAHAQALAGLRRLNRAASAAAQVARPIIDISQRLALKRLTLLDVACGGGDVSAGVARRLARAGISTDLTLMDMSPVALEKARAQATAAGVAANTVRGHAPDALPEGTFDVVICTLFLHHLSREQVIASLREMSARARHAVVVCDLRRHLPGYLLAQVMCRLLSRSGIVHFDGPASVRAAWTVEEMRDMAGEAGLGATVQPCWPSRLRLVEEKGR